MPPIDFVRAIARIIRNFTPDGSSTAHSAPSSARTVIALITNSGVYDRVFPTLVSIDKLRYRLMPYIYSLAWKVTSDDYTIQRPLVMDFRTDPETWNIGDQFMFGPAMMVSPGADQHAIQRRAFICRRSGMVRLLDRRNAQGCGRALMPHAPLDRIPLDVRAGSIIPMGPEIEYANQAPAVQSSCSIYPGANGYFSLYKDSGDGYAYEKGEHAVIPIRWDDAIRR